MTTTQERNPRHSAGKERRGLARNLLTTIPIVLVGSLAMSMNLPGAVEAAEQKRPAKDKNSSPSEAREPIRQAFAASGMAAGGVQETATANATVAAAPTVYTVQAGDTISSIAARYGLSTPSVLALNGLGWKSLIHPGQILTLSKTAAAPITTPSPRAESNRYTIVAGDTMGRIAARFGVSTQSILTANGLGWSSIIYPGQTIAIPGTSAPVTRNAPPAAAAPTPSGGSHTIASGETISSIAAKYGVSIQAILNANGLGWSSLIFAGRTLVIPAATAAAAAPGVVTPMNAEMAANAAIIVSVGRQLGVSDYGLVIALATAMQESTLRNLNWGDRDSLGLFQQRPSQGWGTSAQVTDPAHASKLFFGGPRNPNAANTRGLLDIPGWQSMTVTQAAQAVQLSAFPDAYAKWETSARAWLAQL